MPPAASTAAGVPTSSRSSSPLSPAELRTTSGAIAIGNLDAQIEGLERVLRLRPDDLARGAALVGLYISRARFFGRLSDYDRAAAMARELVARRPDSAEAYRVRAKIRAALHRFEEAASDLDRADAIGPRDGSADGLRASILQAQGRHDDALVLRRRLAQAHPSIEHIGTLAALHAERGEVSEAERLFVEAPSHYKDVSPFPLAWLYVEQAEMWRRAGNTTRATVLLRAAIERVPGFAPAIAALADIEGRAGHPERAVELLRPLAARSEDPDHAAQLAYWLRRLGREDEAAPLVARARRAYERLLRRHGPAFVDHAARFWLEVGGDAERALALARRHAAERKTPAAHELLLKAALAADETSEACRAADAALGQLRPRLDLRLLAADAYRRCDQRERAAALLRGLSPPRGP